MMDLNGAGAVTPAPAHLNDGECEPSPEFGF